METALPLSAFVKSDVALSVRFDSSEITLDDLQAVLQLLGTVVNAAQSEISDRHEEFVFLPVVTVSGGTFRIRIDFKASRWTVEIRATARDVIFAIAILLGQGSVVGPPPQPSPPPVSSQCEERVMAEYGKTLETLQHFGKGFSADIEARCGDETIRSHISVPPAGHR